jgi:hypothetical protein
LFCGRRSANTLNQPGMCQAHRGAFPVSEQARCGSEFQPACWCKNPLHKIEMSRKMWLRGAVSLMTFVLAFMFSVFLIRLVTVRPSLTTSESDGLHADVQAPFLNRWVSLRRVPSG